METTDPVAFGYYWLYFAAFCALGASFASFSTVIASRWGTNRTPWQPKRSYCPYCGKQLSFSANLPILGYLLHAGKCFNCKIPIPCIYILMEVSYAATWGAIFILSAKIENIFKYVSLITPFLYCMLATIILTLIVTCLRKHLWKQATSSKSKLPS